MNTAKIYFIIIILTCPAVADPEQKNTVVLSGAMVQNGVYKLKNIETVSSFLARHGGLRCSDDMLNNYHEGRVVSGIKIYLHRSNEVISISVKKNGNSFFNTLTLRADVIVHVKYNNNMEATFYYYSNILGE